MVMFEGYFDESGDFEENQQIFCVAGYFIDSERAKLMDEKWHEVLRAHNIPYFHMVDCAHGNEPFDKMEKEERIEIVKKFIQIIKDYTIAGQAVLAKADYFEISEKDPDVYSSCVDGCVLALRSWLDIHRMKGDIAYFFESGHKNRGRAYNHVAQRLAEYSASLTFAGKDQVRLLQAADLLAWQCTKYAKDRSARSRPPRKDFISLMEHRHSLAYVSMANGESQVAFEEFPMSVRSPFTSAQSIDRDGPIVLLREDGDDRPIVVIKEAIGWRLGGGRSAYVAFKDLGNKEFYLAFSDISIRETISALLVAATDTYADDRLLAFTASNASVKMGPERFELTVLLASGQPLTFDLTREAIEALKIQIDGLIDESRS